MSSTRMAVVAAVVLAAACSKPQDTTLTKGSEPAAAAAPDEATARQAIETANQRFLEGMQRGDTTVVAQNYADDAIIMMPGEPAWSGENAVHKGFTDFLGQAKISNAKVATEKVVLAGDYAIENGTYDWTVTPKAGKAMHDKGKYLTVWKHQPDGSWKIVRDINNSDLPMK